MSRQRRWRDRTRTGGLVEATVIVPADRADELRAFAAQLRDGRAPRASRRRVADPAQGGLFDDATPPDWPPAHQRGAERAAPEAPTDPPPPEGPGGR